MSKRGCLLFDLDNTLVDRDGAFRLYACDFVERHATFFADADIDAAIEDFLALDCGGRKDRTLFCREVLQRFPLLPHSEKSLWCDHQRLPAFVRADAAVTALLTRLRRDFHLLIISNGSSDMQRRKLRSAGLTDSFDHIFISGEVGHAKPDRRFFSHALQACPHPSIAVIGDDFVNDIEPALALNLKTIFINPRRDQSRIRPDRDIAHIHVLEEALDCMT